MPSDQSDIKPLRGSAVPVFLMPSICASNPHNAAKPQKAKNCSTILKISCQSSFIRGSFKRSTLFLYGYSIVTDQNHLHAVSSASSTETKDQVYRAQRQHIRQPDEEEVRDRFQAIANGDLCKSCKRCRSSEECAGPFNANINTVAILQLRHVNKKCSDIYYWEVNNLLHNIFFRCCKRVHLAYVARARLLQVCVIEFPREWDSDPFSGEQRFISRRSTSSELSDSITRTNFSLFTTHLKRSESAGPVLECHSHAFFFFQKHACEWE